jgi:eukaryotic-like serine/threonine-protein kinase
MDVLPARCDRQTVERFLADQLSAEQSAAFEDHLETCSSCRQTLDSFAAEGNWWQEARAHLNPAREATEGKPTQPPVMAWSPDHAITEQAEAADDVPVPVRALRRYLAPTDDPRMLGRLGGYEIAGIIGWGGMGMVLKGFDLSLNRYVAIKVLGPELARSAAARQRFGREAKAAAAVVHPNVVAIHAVAEANVLPYFVMRYVRGPTLARRLQQSGPLSVLEIVRIGMQVAAGLAAAHAQGLVHRDIKPANILLEEGVERVTITDFGLARAANDARLTQPGLIAGTPQYMSPEQAHGRPVDHRSDLFSLGSVLYALCTGQPPFMAEGSLAVLRRVEEEQPRPIPEINPDMPDWLVAVVERLHAKDPAQRFQTAVEVAGLLECYLAHLQQPLTVPAPPLSFARDRRANTGKPRLFAKASVILILGLGSFFLLLCAFLQRQRPPVDAEHAPEVLQKLGAKITRSETLPNRPIIAVDLRNTEAPESDLIYLKALPQLQTLDLHRTALTDAGGKELGALKQLWRLDVSGTALGDATLPCLGSLERLRELYLGQTRVTDAGLQHLAALPQLEKLGLEATGATDAGMRHVGRLKSLQYLNLGRTKITDAGLRELVGLTELRVLCLYVTGISDAGVKDILAFTKLEKLLIGGDGHRSAPAHGPQKSRRRGGCGIEDHGGGTPGRQGRCPRHQSRACRRATPGTISGLAGRHADRLARHRAGAFWCVVVCAERPARLAAPSAARRHSHPRSVSNTVRCRRVLRVWPAAQSQSPTSR